MRLDKYKINSFLDEEDLARYLDDNDFVSFFKSLYRNSREWDPEEVGGFSTFLYESGVNFLEDIDYVPVCAFYESELESIEVPKNVISIEEYAFAMSKLRVVTLHRTLQEVAENAFYGCKNLEEVNFDGSKDE